MLDPLGTSPADPSAGSITPDIGGSIAAVSDTRQPSTARAADGASSPKVSDKLAAALASVAAELLGKFAAFVECPHRVSARGG